MIPDSQPSVSEADGTLPPQLLSLYSSVQTALQTSFVHSPPYTVQRLAELIISPTNHYKTLPSYLRALDRVISVSSTANNFPLPSLASNGEGDNYSFLGSVDSSEVDDFNGAALTRIPWLRDTASLLSSGERPLTTDLRTESTSLIDGPNGAGSIETVTVSVNGLSNTTRNPMQQRLNVSGRTESEVDARMEHGLASADDLQASNVLVEAEEEEVHARGPEEIGVEDLGPQDAARSPGSNHHLLHSAIFDAEAALGRPGEAEPGPISEVGNK